MDNKHTSPESTGREMDFDFSDTSESPPWPFVSRNKKRSLHQASDVTYLPSPPEAQQVLTSEQSDEENEDAPPSKASKPLQPIFTNVASHPQPCSKENENFIITGQLGNGFSAEPTELHPHAPPKASEGKNTSSEANEARRSFMRPVDAMDNGMEVQPDTYSKPRSIEPVSRPIQSHSATIASERIVPPQSGHGKKGTMTEALLIDPQMDLYACSVSYGGTSVPDYKRLALAKFHSPLDFAFFAVKTAYTPSELQVGLANHSLRMACPQKYNDIYDDGKRLGLSSIGAALVSNELRSKLRGEIRRRRSYTRTLKERNGSADNVDYRAFPGKNSTVLI